MKNEDVNLKKNIWKEGLMGGLGGRKEKGNDVIIMSKTKNNNLKN